jgi:hypothetical protein
MESTAGYVSCITKSDLPTPGVTKEAKGKKRKKQTTEDTAAAEEETPQDL